jgi:hypothetical protein
MIGGLKLAIPGYLAAGAFLWLWIAAEKAETRAIENCEREKAEFAADAESEAQRALNNAHARELAERDRMVVIAQSAVAGSREVARDLRDQNEQLEGRVYQLELEASIDDIPDSQEALNVFIPADALVGVLHAGEPPGAANCGGPGPGTVCADSAGVDGGNETAGDFAPITFGDSLILWGLDRAALIACNDHKRRIRELSDENTATD